jgi:hypothetical protein
MGKRLRLSVWGLVIVTVLAASAAGSAHAEVAPPPTLTGEEFFDPAPTITPTCNPNGTSSITFSAHGVATGPYPGKFTEVGAATIGPQTFNVNGTPIGLVVTFDAVFTIDSPVGQVTGMKTIVAPNVSLGQCAVSQGGDNPPELINVNLHSNVHYTAEIASPQGEFSDHGSNPLVFLNRVTFTQTGVIADQQFFENFASDLTTTEPLTTPGQATGGGQIPGNVTFGLTAKSDQNGVKGNCAVIDRATGTMVKCLDATTYAQTGTHAVIRGNALVNGTPTTYRIVVDDNGEPGSGVDTFTISTGTGYGATGVLSQGNIQVHA